ncbi:hypothetical protein EMPS_07964 [Entomortierella parvispora]|uniref:Major facilitator superfamily (MFS) profile domain-containing protein n=1 Tax=Entomortierella parvispora TaxID=205924 RepID=A0A9P3HF51_9FUNG|nr:hypothetical protein EMPS_07964 [Entomortierella parvispora]
MTSLNAIHLQVLVPVYSSSSSAHGSSNSTVNSRRAHRQGDEKESGSDDSDDDYDEQRHRREAMHDLESDGRYLNVPGETGGNHDPNDSQTMLRLSTAYHSSASSTSSLRNSSANSSHRESSLVLTTPAQTHGSSLFRSHRKHKHRGRARDHSEGHSEKKKRRRPPSVNGVEQALKLNFLSTLGPGIPMTPTASVFGEGLPGFINRDPSNPGGLFGYSQEEEKRLVKKIDWRIIPILGMFYGVSTLNRINLTNARMFAFENSLHATREQFSWAIAVFYVGYGLAEIPSIMALLYLTPKNWLPASMFVWGCITFILAWMKTYHLVLVARFFLGISEAALIPGVLMYISMFYKRSEQTFRLALLQTFSSSAGALGGLISGAIGHLDGVLSLHGWQWIFILESIPTVGLAVLAWFLLTKSPESAPWLDQRETSIAIYRIRNDTKIKVSRKISRRNIIAAVKDPKVYLFMAMNLIMTVPIISSIGVLTRAWMAIATAMKDDKIIPSSVSGGSGNSSSIAGMSPDEPISITGPSPGYLQPGVESVLKEPTSSARMLAQLLSSPSYFLGAVSTFCAAIIADRTQQRGIILMVLAVVSILGYCMVLLTENVYINYAGSLVISMGQTPMTPIVTSWLTTNLGGYAKKAVAVAMFLLSSSIAGVMGSQLYKSRDAPHYTKGHLVNMGCLLFLIIFASIQRFMLKAENNRRNYSVSFGVNPLKFLSKAELRDLNDGHPAFRYTL